MQQLENHRQSYDMLLSKKKSQLRIMLGDLGLKTPGGEQGTGEHITNSSSSALGNFAERKSIQGNLPSLNDHQNGTGVGNKNHFLNSTQGPVAGSTFHSTNNNNRKFMLNTLFNGGSSGTAHYPGQTAGLAPLTNLLDFNFGNVPMKEGESGNRASFFTSSANQI
jgi:hypothetical protein